MRKEQFIVKHIVNSPCAWGRMEQKKTLQIFCVTCRVFFSFFFYTILCHAQREFSMRFVKTPLDSMHCYKMLLYRLHFRNRNCAYQLIEAGAASAAPDGNSFPCFQKFCFVSKMFSILINQFKGTHESLNFIQENPLLQHCKTLIQGNYNGQEP